MVRIIGARKHRKPGKLTLSPTKINTYLACKVMYIYTYVHRLSRFYYRPKLHHSFGASLHRALEEFHKRGGAETQSTEQLTETLHQAWASLGYSSQEEEQEHLEAAAQFLEQYHADYRIEGVKTIATEKMLKHDMGEFNLMGRIDRLDEHPDGHIEVIDYKSGRMSVNQDEVRNDLAMGIYSHLVRKANPERRVTASIYCLRSGEKAEVEFSEEETTALEDGVRAIAAEIARIDEDTVVEPVWLPHVCPECDYLMLCARKMHWDVDKLMREG